jgi:hypothetical protein
MPPLLSQCPYTSPNEIGCYLNYNSRRKDCLSLGVILGVFFVVIQSHGNKNVFKSCHLKFRCKFCASLICVPSYLFSDIYYSFNSLNTLFSLCFLFKISLTINTFKNEILKRSRGRICVGEWPKCRTPA